MRKIILCLLLSLFFNLYSIFAIEPEKAINEAIAYCNVKQYDKAIPILTSLIELCENDSHINYEAYACICHLLGHAYFEQNDINNAYEFYNKGLTSLINLGANISNLSIYAQLTCDVGRIYLVLRDKQKFPLSSTAQEHGIRRIATIRCADAGCQVCRSIALCRLAQADSFYSTPMCFPFGD